MFNRKGQNVVEYSILIAVVVGAAIAMQTYVKRGLQGRIRETVYYTGTKDHDIAGVPLNLTGLQYEPYYQNSTGEVDANYTRREVIGNNGDVNRTGISDVTKRLNGTTDRVEAYANYSVNTTLW